MFRRFSKRSIVEFACIATTTDAYFSFAVSAYIADTKLYGLKSEAFLVKLFCQRSFDSKFKQIIDSKSDSPPKNFFSQAFADFGQSKSILLSSDESKIRVDSHKISSTLANVIQACDGIRRWVTAFDQRINAGSNAGHSNHFAFVFLLHGCCTPG